MIGNHASCGYWNALSKKQARQILKAKLSCEQKINHILCHQLNLDAQFVILLCYLFNINILILTTNHQFMKNHH